MRSLTRTSKILLALLVLAVLVLVLTGCDPAAPSGQKKETATQQDNYNKLVELDPAHRMVRSPTRATINGWIDTWGKDPNKLAYVYIKNSDAQVVEFYVFKGLPVSMCTALTPPYQIRDDQDGNLLVPAPSMDAVYYSGGECSRYYGFDATSGSYMEFTVGVGQNFQLFDQPLAPNLVGDAQRVTLK